MKKIAIFHPQITTFGGGEFVSLVIAETLSKKYEVDIITPFKVKKEQLKHFFNLNLENINIKHLGLFVDILVKIPTINTYKYSFYVRKALKLKNYDLIFDTGTNGMFNKKIDTKTVCCINYKEFPTKKRGWKRITNFLLMDPKNSFKYNMIITNSDFTRKAVKNYSDGKDSTIINPPVKVKDIKQNKKKKNKIVTIGRLTYEKKHEILIEAFKKIYKNNKDWEFHIIGAYQENVSPYEKDYLVMIKNISKHFPIFFHQNMPHEDVLKFVSDCKLYWHARGYGETHPDEMENFGICTVEGMAAGCVPIVINLGAQPEIVDHGKNGYTWNEPNELIEYTQKVIDNPRLMSKLGKKSREKSLKYDISIFREKINRVVKELIGE